MHINPHVTSKATASLQTEHQHLKSQLDTTFGKKKFSCRIRISPTHKQTKQRKPEYQNPKKIQLLMFPLKREQYIPIYNLSRGNSVLKCISVEDFLNYALNPIQVLVSTPNEKTEKYT